HRCSRRRRWSTARPRSASCRPVRSSASSRSCRRWPSSSSGSWPTPTRRSPGCWDNHAAMATVHGDVDDGFGRVADAFAANFTEHGDVGAACTLTVDGRVVVDVWGGDADRVAARPWAPDTLVITFSTTKGVTAIVCNRLIEQGRLDPDAPVAHYWPEFAA